MAMVRIIVRDLAIRRESPARLLRHLNILLKKDIKKNLFVTLFCGLMDRREGMLDFASAAHMPLIIYHAKENVIRQIDTCTKPLGFFSDKDFTETLEEKRVELKPGDLFMQFTDGLTEMRNEAGEEYGIERVMQLALDSAKGGARHMIEDLKRSLDKFRGGAPQSDDLTLLAVSALQEGMTRAPEDRMEMLDRVVFE
jgi:sigma-B regulation protein RsbU (phosphoserine phosphatase)